ncbi:jg14343 [Pararge aegeria aegeria]|uniref:Jg14343 protein n=1 Tax=Pararge aegeria aegeria TaxID=348720 RepID=A0A8S4R4H3_9NEOP|nr:jg14343 [Pararge aegeria aegeria]
MCRLDPAATCDALNVVCPPCWGSTNAALTSLLIELVLGKTFPKLHRYQHITGHLQGVATQNEPFFTTPAKVHFSRLRYAELQACRFAHDVLLHL